MLAVAQSHKVTWSYMRHCNICCQRYINYTIIHTITYLPCYPTRIYTFAACHLYNYVQRFVVICKMADGVRLLHSTYKQTLKYRESLLVKQHLCNVNHCHTGTKLKSLGNRWTIHCTWRQRGPKEYIIHALYTVATRHCHCFYPLFVIARNEWKNIDKIKEEQHRQMAELSKLYT